MCAQELKLISNPKTLRAISRQLEPVSYARDSHTFVGSLFSLFSDDRLERADTDFLKNSIEASVPGFWNQLEIGAGGELDEDILEKCRQWAASTKTWLDSKAIAVENGDIAGIIREIDALGLEYKDKEEGISAIFEASSSEPPESPVTVEDLSFTSTKAGLQAIHDHMTGISGNVALHGAFSDQLTTNSRLLSRNLEGLRSQSAVADEDYTAILASLEANMPGALRDEQFDPASFEPFNSNTLRNWAHAVSEKALALHDRRGRT